MLDKLLTEVSSIDELKALYIETFLNHTNKVSKISDLSVLNAHAYGIAKLLQKDLKDTAILESQLFPALSSGVYLDNAAKLVGGIARLSAVGSSTFVLVHASEGTIYIPGESQFTSNQGIPFAITDVVAVGANSYSYIPVRSIPVGERTNVDPLSINSISNPPDGHISCTNEYKATGGRDTERDEDFKARLLTFEQFSANPVKNNLLANLQALEPTIIDVMKVGYDESGKLKLMLVTCNGQWFTNEELGLLESKLVSFLNLSDVNLQGTVGVKLVNTQWHAVGGKVGVDFRVELVAGYSDVDVRKDIQIRLTKYFDFRYWNGNKIQWDDLLGIVKSVQGIKYVPDEFFAPNVDELVEIGKLPRIVTFIMRNMEGTVLYNSNNKVAPIYYPV